MFSSVVWMGNDHIMEFTKDLLPNNNNLNVCLSDCLLVTRQPLEGQGVNNDDNGYNVNPYE